MSTYPLVKMLDPFILTPSTIESNLFKSVSAGAPIYVFWVGIKVRDMGTATYVRVGLRNAAIDTLIGKNAYTEYDAPAGAVLDVSEVVIISDTNDAVVEVTGIRVG